MKKYNSWKIAQKLIHFLKSSFLKTIFLKAYLPNYKKHNLATKGAKGSSLEYIKHTVLRLNINKNLNRTI